MEQPTSSRNVNIDLIRIISMFLVVGSHIIIKPFSNLPIASNLLFKIFCAADCIFFMISGYFNLGIKFSSATDIKRFYLKRAVSIFLPYFVMSIALFIWSDIYSTGNLHMRNFPRGFYNAFMGGNSSSYFWFMYYLIGFTLSTPILARAFSDMSDSELRVIFIIGLIWIAISSYMTAAFGIKYEYKGWILSNWAMAYFSGYYVKRMSNRLNCKIFYIIGLASFILRVIALTYLPGNWHFSDGESVLYFISSISAFVFMLNTFTIKNDSTKKIIGFLSTVSFYVYLIHPAVILELSPLISRIMSRINHGAIIFCLYYLMTLVISIIIATVLYYLIFRPIQKKLNKRISEIYPL